jgi:hypothetical protein
MQEEPKIGGEGVARHGNRLFRSFFQAGFECSTHIMGMRNRLDLIASTRHDRFARQDFNLLIPFGMRTVREGARWHLIESQPGRYNFDSLDVILDPAEEAGIEVILDLFHFGWPDHIDIFGPEFVGSFGQFTRALVRRLKERGWNRPFLVPVNEISFMSWGAGDKGFVFPFAVGRGDELKRILVRAAIRTSQVILDELPGARLVSPEPMIHIVGDPGVEGSEADAKRYRNAQFQAWDMLSGNAAPELGGRPEYLDVLGVNYYDRNQWVHNSDVSLKRNDPRYLPFRQLLEEAWSRYRRPMVISETGAEDDTRPDWFLYICREVSAAIDAGVPMNGICLYPILNHPGWEDNRHCFNGLFDYADDEGRRQIYKPLAQAILQAQRTGEFRGRDKQTHDDEYSRRSNMLFASSLGIRVPTTSAPDEPLCEV